MVEVLYVVRFGELDYEFVDPNSLFDFVVRGLTNVPDEHLPAAMDVLNIDEFSRDQIERDHSGFYFRSEMKRSRLGKAFCKYWKEEEELDDSGFDSED